MNAPIGHLRGSSLGIALFLLTTLVACQPAARPAAPVAPAAAQPEQAAAAPAVPLQKKTLVIATSRDHTLMGHFGTAQTDAEVSDIVYAGLVRKNALTLTDDPWLAQEVPSRDRGTWIVNADGTMVTTYKLRPNLTWHDGTPLSSKDLVLGWEMAIDPRTGFGEPSVAKTITRVETPDDQTLVLHWKETYRRADAVYRNRLMPVPRHLFEEMYRAGQVEQILNHPNWTSASFVGNGPYKIVRWDQGQVLELEAFDQYALGKPRIDRIEWRFIFDVNTVLANVLSNNVDVVLREAYNFDTALIAKQQWESRGNGQVLFTPVTIQWVNLTPLNPWLVDPRVRRGLMHAINRQEMTETLSQGLEPVAHIPLPPKRPQYERALAAATKYDYDPTRARQLLTEAGWSPGADGILVNGRGERFAIDARAVRNDVMQSQAATVDYWKRVGVETQINNISSRQESAEEYRGRWSGAFWQSASVSVESWINRFGTANIPAAETRWFGDNQTRWADPAKEAVLQELEQTFDPRRADDLIVDFSRLYSEQLPDLPLRYLAEVMSVRKGVVNLHPRAELGGQNTRTWNAEQWDWN